MEDGLPGTNIAQIGLASFANSARMHRDARAAGNLVVTMDDVRRDGIRAAVDRAADHLAKCETIVIDCDIDVIDRSQMPGAPGARPGGMDVADFFWAVRALAGLGAGARDRPYRMGSVARPDRSERAHRRALGRRMRRRL
jgi:formiminoglutamase